MRSMLHPAPSASCYLPEWLERGRAWGVSVQLYEIRSDRDWGIGDYEDLAQLVTIAGEAGASFVGLNPLHALFLGEPNRRSAFSPSYRRFLNPLYIAIDKVDGFENGMVDEAVLSKLRSARLVDYPGVAEVKLAALRQIWREQPAKIVDADQQLRLHALFEALSLHMVA